MMKLILWLLLVVALIAAEFFKVYFIMPFPGSQESDTIDIAYSLHKYIWFIRIPLWILATYLLYKIFNRERNWQKIIATALLGFYCVVLYMFNFRFLADKMFLQPETKVMAKPADNTVPKDMVVLGVVINGEARAYPVEIIGYHHQVLDTVGGKPVMVTYCTVCRTGRVFSPIIDGKYETFRLVGMDHFNAMFEDATTKSWWRQVNGEAIKGPMAGKKLEELDFTQTTLASWLEKYPESLVLQFDPKFAKKYEGLSGYDRGTIGGRLEGTDTASWKPKSWVVGVEIAGKAKAYDWNLLKKQRTINDTLNNVPILIALEPDSLSFHVWQRMADNSIFTFRYHDSLKLLVDNETHSVWNFKGTCITGPSAGKTLQRMKASQEYWHSWQTFEPRTGKYGE